LYHVSPGDPVERSTHPMATHPLLSLSQTSDCAAIKSSTSAAMVNHARRATDSKPKNASKANELVGSAVPLTLLLTFVQGSAGMAEACHFAVEVVGRGVAHYGQ
jgi:hypothetical protein